MQVPSVFNVGGLSAKFTGHHYFLGLAYQRQISRNWKVGGGAGISYAAFTATLSGSYMDSSGVHEVYERITAPMIWYPFDRGFTGTYSVRSDPFHLWAEAIRTIKANDRGSRWEASFLFGGLSPLGWATGIGADVLGSQMFGRTPAYAISEYGYRWHVLIGLGFDRVIAIKHSNAITIGLEWRRSLTHYFEQELGMVTANGEYEIHYRKRNFNWLGLRIGFDLTLRRGGKQKWLQELDDKGLPRPEQ